MAATITEAYAAELVQRWTEAGLTEDAFRSITGFPFQWASNATHNRARQIEARLSEMAPRVAPAATRPVASVRTARVAVRETSCYHSDTDCNGVCYSCGAQASRPVASYLGRW